MEVVWLLLGVFATSLCHASWVMFLPTALHILQHAE
jgi:hypothetical protein